MPLAFADPSAGDDIASERIASGPPTDFLDNLSAAWESSRLNDRYVGAGEALAEAYDKANEQIYKSSGIKLPNPARGQLPPGTQIMGVTDDPRTPITNDFAAGLYEEYARKQGITPLTFKDATAQAHAAMFGAETKRNDVTARSSGFGGDLGGFLGTAAAVGTDPPVLTSMMFGGPETSTLLGAMAREAGLAGTTEAMIQPSIQTERVKAGLPGGFEQGAENVAMAAGGAAGLTALFRGAGAAYGAARRAASDFKPRTAAEADTARYVERYSALQEANPLVDTPAAAAEHADRVSVAQAAHANLEPDPSAPANSDMPSNPISADAPRSPTGRIPVPDDLPAAQAAATVGQRLAQEARTSQGGLDAFVRARATANDLASGGALEDSSLDLARGPKPVQPKDDPSLVQFVINRGGINDADRTLAQANVAPRDRPGLISRTGMSASQMSELASEAGYFPPAGVREGGRAVDQRELATALRDELDGQKLYARHGATGNPEARAAFEANTRTHADVNRALSELGLDPRQMTNDDLRESVNSIANVPDAKFTPRTDYTAEAVDRADATARDLDDQYEHQERAAISSENDLRAIYADRMDEPVYIELNGEVHAVPARHVFEALDADDRLVKEFENCINGVPF